MSINKDQLLSVLLSLISDDTEKQPDNSILGVRYVGRYVICRSRNEGVNFGKVVALDETGVVLEGARRLYYHRPKNKSVSWYEGVAKEGLSSDSKTGAAVEKLITEDYSLTLCSDTASKSIKEAPDYEQN